MSVDLNPVVFVGPTISVAEIREYLPEARICPPVRCGDVLAVLRLVAPPSPIVIIDGSFETVGATWHKEILWALSCGYPVYGASSMGALRAAELAEYGMQGFGKIFRDYRSGRLVNDDEVAVLHQSGASGYAPLNDALVNIRATLDSAVSEGLVTPEQAAVIVERAQGTFYPDRVLTSLLDEQGGEAHKQLAEWLPTGMVDLKRLDAIELLRHLGSDAVLKSSARPADSTAFVRALMAYVGCRPAPFDVEWLSEQEQLCRASRLFGTSYLMARQLALALSFADAAETPVGRVEPEAVEHAFDVLIKEFGFYAAHRNSNGNDEAMVVAVALARRLAEVWCGLERRFSGDIYFEPQPNQVADYAAALARDHGLESREDIWAWRKQNDLLEPSAFAAFVLASMKRRHCLTPNSGDALGIGPVCPQGDYLYRALFETGFAAYVKKALAAPVDGIGRIASQWIALAPDGREALAQSCDFLNYQEVEAELSRLGALV